VEQSGGERRLVIAYGRGEAPVFVMKLARKKKKKKERPVASSIFYQSGVCVLPPKRKRKVSRMKEKNRKDLSFQGGGKGKSDYVEI